MASSVETANEFLRQKPLTQMQIQKLVFIANGFNLAINKARLVNETYQAWDHGPVEPRLRDHVSRYGSQPVSSLLSTKDTGISWMLGDKKEVAPYQGSFNNSERDIINHVLRIYGKLSAFRLSELTHLPDTPWFRAYSKGRNTEILDEDIIEHYTDLLRKGRVARG